MVILGLTGPIGSGKSTFATYLRARAGKYQEFESSDLIMSVANALKNTAESDRPPDSKSIKEINAWLKPLPQILAEQVHTSVKPEQIYLTDEIVSHHPELTVKLFEYLAEAANEPAVWGELINRSNKARHRALLQWLGGYLPKRVDGKIWYDELVHRAIADTGSVLATIGGVRFPADAACIKEAGGYIVGIERPGMQMLDKHDVTERERDLVKADTVIINNGTLEELQECAGSLWRDLAGGQLQPHYVCHKA